MATKAVLVRGAFAYDADVVSRETGIAFDPDEGLTDPSHAEECDINEIVRRFGITGQLPQNVQVPLSGDFVEAVTDFQTAMNAVRAAEEGFMQLPAEVRARFDNDPGKLIAFVEDDKNREEAEKLGIVVKKPQQVSEKPVEDTPKA